MPDLIAQGPQPEQRWRRNLPEGSPVTIGRAAGVWSVAWDPQVSRRHVQLLLRGERLQVTCLPAVRNPIYFRGQEAASFTLRPGEHFVIAETTFTLADQRVTLTTDSPPPFQQQTFSSQYLQRFPFRNPDHRIEVLSRLPQLVADAAGEGELCVRLVSMLLAGLPRSAIAAVVAVEDLHPAGDGPQPTSESGAAVRVLHWDQRVLAGGEVRPSQRLILEAFRQHQSVLHVWVGAETAEPFTAAGQYDWAFCTPVVDPYLAIPPGDEPPPAEPHSGWALYVAGRLHAEHTTVSSATDPGDLRDELKFAELVAAFLAALRRMRGLQRQHANLSQFFSPIVLDSLAGEDPDLALAPRETDVVVLFCDLRGFTQETERHADQLMELLERVSGALGVMTRRILDEGGVVGDFQGDAAMGFWGWPIAHDDAVLRTCRAALGVRAEFESAARQQGSPLTGFHAGIGIASGRAVAGKIGTVDQVKVTVFGPAVNLASRLEGMTKVLKAPILLDEATAEAVRGTVSATTARVRRLAVVRPYGSNRPVLVSELLPPEGECALADEHLGHYEAALDAFLAGHWSRALDLLHRVPTDDLVTDFLTAYIVRHHRIPPRDWDGVIPIESK